MKTILTIALFMITTITFAQELKNNQTNTTKPVMVIKSGENKAAESSYVKFGDIKGESKSKSSKIKNSKNKPNAVRSGYMKIGDIKGESARSTSRKRRVEVLKSNKQGDPNKK